jgi:hypothetical protein
MEYIARRFIAGRSATSYRSVDKKFPTAEEAIAFLAKPWKDVAATSGEVIEIDPSINRGSQVTRRLASRRNGEKIIIKEQAA